ncbi:DUF2442 domain-containing protein [bacterium]|nr:DUF2442 domain-containing protein [bacterium]
MATTNRRFRPYFVTTSLFVAHSVRPRSATKSLGHTSILYPQLRHGTDAKRANWRLIGNGVGVHWPDVEKDIGVEGLVLGQAGAGERSVLGGVPRFVLKVMHSLSYN